MNNTEYLVHRLEELLLSGRWVLGTNFKEQIEDLSWTEATQQFADLNTIASLTFHIDYYLAGVLEVFKGGELTIRDKYSFDAPVITCASDWITRKDTFLKNAVEFIELIKNMPDERLNDVFVKEEYGTYRRSVDVIIEHTYYHLGQIVVIKKLIRQ